MELIARADAKANGSKYFFTGIPCKNGHVCVRFVSDNGCTECKKMHSQIWYSDKERAAAKTRRWRSDPKNKEAERLNRKALREKDPEKHRAYSREWHSSNPEAAKAKWKRWYQKNINEQRAKALVYRNNNLEEARRKSREWCKNNPEQVAVNARKRRALQSGNGGTHTTKDVADIFKMQRGKCAICRVRLGKKYHVDHIIPLVAGGSNDRRNLQIACGPCNQSKSARDPVAFMQMRGMLL